MRKEHRKTRCLRKHYYYASLREVEMLGSLEKRWSDEFLDSKQPLETQHFNVKR
jgi:hypothetical protein